jgi:geranylgeranyl diphosphate synthase type II
MSTKVSQPSAAASNDALGLLKRHAEAVEAYMADALKRQTQAPPLLIEAMDYSLMAGGKRLRPTLVLESAIACGAGIPPANPNRSALAAAGAIELIHTFSLVHDDLPAMDNDDLRRGRPTNHKVYGDAMAILAGDAMVSLAFELIATDAESSVAPKLIAELAHATGPQGMIGGQVLDMDGEQKSLKFEQLQQLHRMKTGALLRSACRMGAISTNASEVQLLALTDFGRYLGLAFQIVDDLLDVTASPEQMGKATGKDAAKGKNTYPALLGIEETRKQARIQLESALAAIKPLGRGGDGLRKLAEFVVEREM